MIETGRFNQLEIAEITDVGLLLVAGEGRTLFLPIEQVDRKYRPGDTLAVFVFVDADGNPVATTRRPAAELGQVAWLEIVEVNDLGAFANDRFIVECDAGVSKRDANKEQGITVLLVFQPAACDESISLTLHLTATGCRVGSAAFSPSAEDYS